MKHYWLLVSSNHLKGNVLVKTHALDEEQAKQKTLNFFRVNKNTEIKIIEIATIKQI